jgi:hypothetical protein
LDELGVGGRKILVLTLNTMRGVKWIYLAEGRDKWCALFEQCNELPGSTVSVKVLCFWKLSRSLCTHKYHRKNDRWRNVFWTLVCKNNTELYKLITESGFCVPSSSFYSYSALLLTFTVTYQNCSTTKHFWWDIYLLECSETWLNLTIIYWYLKIVDVNLILLTQRSW